jgi:hypothetical protein
MSVLPWHVVRCQRRLVALPLLAAVAGAALGGPPAPPGALPACSLAGYSFHTLCREHQDCGNASGAIAKQAGSAAGCARAEMSSTGAPAAAGFASPLFAVDPEAVYNTSWLVMTDYTTAKGCAVAGTVVVQFYDAHDLQVGPTRDADGWAPAQEPVCEKDSTAGQFEPRHFAFSAPTTAKAARLWLFFADGLLTRSTASGNVSLADVRLAKVPGSTRPIPLPRFFVPDPVVQRGINMSTNCLRDSALQGNFTVGSDYQTSTNISPDRGFGAIGVRRFGTPELVAQYQREWGYDNAAVDGQPDGAGSRRASFRLRLLHLADLCLANSLISCILLQLRAGWSAGRLLQARCGAGL